MNNITFCAKSSAATVLSQFTKKKSENSHHFCLMYHSINNDEAKLNDLYSLSTEKFRAQMEFIRSSGCNLIPFSGQSFGVSVTFDDGHLDNYAIAAPFLIEKKIPFTIFMISDFISSSRKEYLNKEHLIELARSPLVTIGTHGKTHRPLALLPFEEAKEELKGSKFELEDILGKEVTVMSFPHGSFSKELLCAAKSLGYKNCGTSIARGNPINKDSIQVDRHCIYSCETMLSFKQKINGKWDWLARDIS